VFKSVDGGRTWRASGTGMDLGSSHLKALGLAAHPTEPGVVFASTSGGLFKSTDGAQSWRELDVGYVGFGTQDIGFDSETGAILVGTEDQGVARSLDGGATWTAAKGIESANVQALLVDPASPGTVYAGTWTWGIYKSRDSGLTWARIPGSDRTHPDIMSLALDPATPGGLLVGTGGGGVYRFDPRARPAPRPATPSRR